MVLQVISIAEARNPVSPPFRCATSDEKEERADRCARRQPRFLDRPAQSPPCTGTVASGQLTLPEKNFMVSDRFSLESAASTFMSLNRMGRKDLGVEKPVFLSQRAGDLLE